MMLAKKYLVNDKIKTSCPIIMPYEHNIKMLQTVKMTKMNFEKLPLY